MLFTIGNEEPDSFVSETSGCLDYNECHIANIRKDDTGYAGTVQTSCSKR